MASFSQIYSLDIQYTSSHATVVQRSFWNAKFQCEVIGEGVLLLSLKGALDCFLSVAFRTVCWSHVEFGCSSAGNVERKSGVCVRLYKCSSTKRRRRATAHRRSTRYPPQSVESDRIWTGVRLTRESRSSSSFYPCPIVHRIAARTLPSLIIASPPYSPRPTHSIALL